jgi:7,8-dihydroneopterin aldolase/epimerase/oxygenase
MDQILLCDLEVHLRIGVTEAERARPQRLLVSLEMEHDVSRAAAADNLAETIDYYAVAQRLLHFGDNREWELIETLASDIAQMVLKDFGPHRVTVEVKKFVIPQARHVAVKLTRSKPTA